MERRLSAILAADVVGYSALMEQDEAGTFDRLRAHRKGLFEPEIEKHHGRIFKLTGDGLFAEFASVVDAVECAVSVQRGLAERNANVPEDQRIDVRIGINLGEVIVDGEDRLGEGVNIAARLEQLADPGGILVSGKVTKEVEKKLAFGFEPMGEQKVKNINEPILVFKVKLDAIPRRTAAKTREMPKWSWVLVLALRAMPPLLRHRGVKVIPSETKDCSTGLLPTSPRRVFRRARPRARAAVPVRLCLAGSSDLLYATCEDHSPSRS
jgi:class 3 adenylate cyclase